jgi:L-fucose isomerase-like protein
MQIIDNIYIFGEIKALLVEGDYTDDELNTYGGFGVVHIPNLQDVLKILCEEGFAHHVAASLSQVGDIVHEALTKYLQWTLIYHNKP